MSKNKRLIDVSDTMRKLADNAFMETEDFEIRHKPEPVSKPMFGKQQRNDPCRCGSGFKYKKCCINNVVVKDDQFKHATKEDILKDIKGFVNKMYDQNMKFNEGETNGS